jgi:Poly A polymerase head domain/Probable RNA and SrmB- binding site of polymerase A
VRAVNTFEKFELKVSNQQEPLEQLPVGYLLNSDPELWGTVRVIADVVAKRVMISPRHPIPLALVFGGAVRDLILGKKIKDIDIQVYGVAPLELEEILKREFPKQIDRAGKGYEVLKLTLKSKKTVDISCPRQQTYAISSHELGDATIFPLDAAKYRDFTINSISLDPLTGILFDPFGGIKDLNNKTLRIVDSATFSLRPIHCYRALQFAARYNFSFDKQTLLELHKLTAEHKDLKGHAIREELKKLLLLGENPDVGVKIGVELGIIDQLFPEILTALRDKKAETLWLKKLAQAAKIINLQKVNEQIALIIMFSQLFLPLKNKYSEAEIIQIVGRYFTNLNFSSYFVSATVQTILYGCCDLREELTLLEGGRALALKRISMPARLTERVANILQECSLVDWRALLCTVAVNSELAPDSLRLSFVRAYDKLKNLGKVKHLSLITEHEIEDILKVQNPSVSKGELRAIVRELVTKRHDLVTRTRAIEYVKEFYLNFLSRD